jgi:hypothetical protein
MPAVTSSGWLVEVLAVPEQRAVEVADRQQRGVGDAVADIDVEHQRVRGRQRRADQRGDAGQHRGHPFVAPSATTAGVGILMPIKIICTRCFKLGDLVINN